jgi:peptide-methionine (S)-S-oxide reductase
MSSSRLAIFAAASLILGGCTRSGESADTAAASGAVSATTAQATANASGKTPASIDSPRVIRVSDGNGARPKAAGMLDTAMFAGGCFWSMERPFDHVPGVHGTTVGYAGGHTENPTYEQVNTGKTGHTETVLVEFDPSVVTYEKLLDVYWHNIDPVTKDRQFCDGGPDYRTVIFTHGAAQQTAAAASKAALEKTGHFKRPIVTEIVANAPFWRAEEYHQHYADRNPQQYGAYKRGCGRDARLRELWGNAAAPFVPATE